MVTAWILTGVIWALIPTYIYVSVKVARRLRGS